MNAVMLTEHNNLCASTDTHLYEQEVKEYVKIYKVKEKKVVLW